MKNKFKRLHEGAKIPKKATVGSAAYDLSVTEDVIIKPGRQIIPLGFALEMEPGYQALVEPRSGFSSKGMEGYEVVRIWTYESPLGYIRGFADRENAKEPNIKEYISREKELNIKEYVSREPERFDCDVIVGKIDADYRDGIGVILNNRDKRTFLIKKGTRIAQLTFLKVENVEWEETDTLSETDREGGFGSTGTK